MSSTPRWRLFSGDVPQHELASNGSQMQHSDSSDIESNSINRTVSCCDGMHVEQINVVH